MTYTAERPLRVAIVGSGPAAFFTAESLLQQPVPCAVDMYERLPVPFGLVRYGVAPDHLRLRSVTGVFDKTAKHPRFRFRGNLTIGRDLSVAELRAAYEAVVLAHGAPADRLLGIPGETLPGCLSANDFALWYNGHPEACARHYPLDTPTAVIIGQGNVAMDVARLLAKTAAELATCDAPAYVQAALGASQVRHIHMIGRRGPAQTAFSTKELRELSELPSCDLIIDPAELALNPASEEELTRQECAVQARNLALMRELAVRPPAGKPRRLYLRFLLSPVQVLGTDRATQIVYERNRLEGEPGHQRAVGTGERLTEDAGLLLRSIGAFGAGLPGLPFDSKRGVYPNVAGRVQDAGQPLPGVYAVGWIGRGPQGVIGATKADAAGVVAQLAADLPQLPTAPDTALAALDATLAARHLRVVTYADWQRLDQREIAAGAPLGKPREKFIHVADMLAALGPG